MLFSVINKEWPYCWGSSNDSCPRGIQESSNSYDQISWGIFMLTLPVRCQHNLKKLGKKNLFVVDYLFFFNFFTLMHCHDYHRSLRWLLSLFSLFPQTKLTDQIPKLHLLSTWWSFPISFILGLIFSNILGHYIFPQYSIFTPFFVLSYLFQQLEFIHLDLVFRIFGQMSYVIVFITVNFM